MSSSRHFHSVHTMRLALAKLHRCEALNAETIQALLDADKIIKASLRAVRDAGIDEDDSPDSLCRAVVSITVR